MKILLFVNDNFHKFDAEDINTKAKCPAFMMSSHPLPLPLYCDDGPERLGFLITNTQNTFYLYLFVIGKNDNPGEVLTQKARQLVFTLPVHALTQVCGVMKRGTKFFPERIPATYTNTGITSLEKSYEEMILNIVNMFDHFDD
ncbi:hypothetical protein A2242_00340 [Candidatus Falkowbacteria bacterium RIFOXYA2_FULL_47_9]|nr:MAG: hypothetical protein A2242_00340 [Candidatus Falkowbacteria bacterium RIFOXYA2_FULL_47_9]